MYNVELDCIWIWKLMEIYFKKKLNCFKKHNLSQQKHGIILEHFGFIGNVNAYSNLCMFFILTWCQLTLVDWTSTWVFFPWHEEKKENGKKNIK
jgi:hypothetical protein